MDSSVGSGIDHAADSVDHNRQDKDRGSRGVDVGVAVAVQALAHQVAQQGAQDAEEHAQQTPAGPQAVMPATAASPEAGKCGESRAWRSRSG